MLRMPDQAGNDVFIVNDVSQCYLKKPFSFCQRLLLGPEPP
jgi:hypothetical protein